MGYLHHRLLATSCAHPKSSWPKSKIFVHLKMHTSWLQSPQNPRTRRRTPLRSFTTRKLFCCSSPPQHFERELLSQIRTKRCGFLGQVPWQFAWHALPQPTNRSAEFRYKKWSRKHQMASRAARLNEAPASWGPQFRDPNSGPEFLPLAAGRVRVTVHVSLSGAKAAGWLEVWTRDVVGPTDPNCVRNVQW